MHGHPISEAAGCSGSFQIPPLDLAHAASPTVVAVFLASYTDAPGPGLPPLTGQAFLVLPPGGTPSPDAGAPDASVPSLADGGTPDAGDLDASAP
jgi:hypothetical protein